MPAGRFFVGSNLNIGSVGGIITISGTVDGTFAGGTQYIMGTTAAGDSKLGTLFIGVNDTTAKALVLSASGGISNVDTINFIAAGTVDAVVTGTVTALPSGTQSVSIVGQPIGVSGTVTSAFAPSGTQDVNVVNAGVAVSGTVSLSGTSNFILVSGTVSTVTALPIVTVTASANPIVISGTVTDIPSGTQTVVFGATQPISGSVSVINTPTVTIGGTANVNILSGTNRIGNAGLVAHQSRISGYLSHTTSTNAIVITSGAHTLYIQDIVISVETAMNIKFFSAATTLMGPLFFATQGGTKLKFIQPIVLTSNQSLTVTPSASGTCSVYADGYTVT